jgi:hypothetical protein
MHRILVFREALRNAESVQLWSIMMIAEPNFSVRPGVIIPKLAGELDHPYKKL